MKFKLLHLLAVSTVAFSTHAWGQVVLITATEAALPDAKITSSRGISRGPSISVTSPLEVNAGSFPIKIAVTARDGTKIDPKSVQIEYLKSPLVDLTPRVLPGVSDHGIAIDNVTVPQGQHHIRVLASDNEGRQAVYQFQLTAR